MGTQSRNKLHLPFALSLSLAFHLRLYYFTGLSWLFHFLFHFFRPLLQLITGILSLRPRCKNIFLPSYFKIILHHFTRVGPFASGLTQFWDTSFCPRPSARCFILNSICIKISRRANSCQVIRN